MDGSHGTVFFSNKMRWKEGERKKEKEERGETTDTNTKMRKNNNLEGRVEPNGGGERKRNRG